MEFLLGLSLTGFFTIVIIDTVQHRRVNNRQKMLTKR